MFTGIVQDVGRICAIHKSHQQTEFVFSTHLDTSAWRKGDSIAVDGCCLTITSFPAGGEFSAIVSPETMRCTRFDVAGEGMAVNLEPALCLGDSLGGHLLTGHIDDTATVKSVESLGEQRVLAIELPPSLGRYVVVKGSIAINGVSLTVNTIQGNCLKVHLIPHTLSHTNLGMLAKGDCVNIETDLIGRYVERLLFAHRQE
jgi:riboflavin synthase